MPIFELRCAISVKSHVLKLWFGLVEIGGLLMSRGRVTCDLRCPFSNLAGLF